MDLKKFIRERCYDFGTLYALEEEFNKLGLSIQQTCGGDMVLCQLRGGQPIAESLGVDHIYVGAYARPRDQIPQKLLKCVLEFIDSARGSAGTVATRQLPHRIGHTGFYGAAIGAVVQGMALDQVDADDDLLDAIREWCNDQV